MTYAGDLVVLRPVTPDDAEMQHRWFADIEITRYLGLRYPLSIGAIAERLAEGRDYRFTVLRRDTGEPVGYTALRGVTPENLNGELDLAIGERSAWNGGFGTDTTRTICRYGFERLNLHRIHLWVFAEHHRAIRVYEKVGFVREAVSRDRLYKHGKWHDTLLMGLLAEEWAG